MLQDFRRRFERRAERAPPLLYELRPGATEEDLQAAEGRLGTALPPAVRDFYAEFDGLSIERPNAIEVFPAKRLERDPGTARIPFAKVYGSHLVCFDSTALNNADQWDIVFRQTGYRITHTLGSFLENKLWKFMDSEGTTWIEDVLALQGRGRISTSTVWVFVAGSSSRDFPARAEAEAWIASGRLTGALCERPVGCGLYEYCVRNGLFCPSSAKETSPEFIASFSQYLDHYHFVDGASA